MYKIPEKLKAEINDYGLKINEFRSGNLEAVKFKGIRVPMGIYEQREDDVFMVRIRCAGGFITPEQLQHVVKTAKLYNAKHIHITTRQEIQIQNVKLEDTHKILEELQKVGLSSRGGGGNTVRNIMASIDSGISEDDVFDVLPFAEALTNKLISESDSWTLPRKFKIAFSSTSLDNAHAAFNDLGFIATIKDNIKGFKVYLGGSLGSKPMVGYVLFDFIDVNEILYIADAAKKLFSRYGNRRNRHKARLHFVFKKLGKEKVFEYFHEIYNEVKTSSNLELILETNSFKSVIPKIKEIIIDNPEYNLWIERYVKSQKQAGLMSIEIPVNHGNLSLDTSELLVQYFQNFGDDVIRFSMRQNIHLRNIPKQFLGNIYQFLIANNFEINKAKIINSLVSCTGADTCRLGICLSKGSINKLKEELKESELNLDELKDLKINISGCPNSCGQHFSADLGFSGKVGRTDRIYPAYSIVAGAKVGGKDPKLAESIDEISARDLPLFTLKFLKVYLSKKNKFSSFSEYIENGGVNDIHQICDEFKKTPSFDLDKNYYFDWGAQNIFSVAGRGDGQCSSGLFDMIDFDFNNIKKYKGLLLETNDKHVINDLLYKIIFSASRMLLITRGVEPRNTSEIFDGFIKQFISYSLIDPKFKTIIELARDMNDTDFTKHKGLILSLAGSVIELYENMDDSLQFTNIEINENNIHKIKPSALILKKDYRGVTCPMNFVKTKMQLATLKSGERLEVLLDDGEPIDNVPGSVKTEGHKIIKQEKIEDFWSVIIEKS